MMLPTDRFIEFIQRENLCDYKDPILAATSGGKDSVLLVHLLQQCGFTFGVAHCNFQLRGAESNRDQDFCAYLAKDLSVPFHTVNLDARKYAADHHLSIQMAARHLRYEWFETVRQRFKYTVIALGHHGSDSVETIMLNLIRGTGIAGMRGILPKNGYIIRPLLFLHGAEIQQIVKEVGLPFVEDSSNSSTKYARNKIRLEIVPKLKELNPKLEDTFAHTIDHFRELEQLLLFRLQELRRQLFQVHGQEIHIAKSALDQLYPKKLLLGYLLKDYGINKEVVGDLIAALKLNHSCGKWFASPTWQLFLDREKIVLVRKEEEGVKACMIQREDRVCFYNNYSLKLSTDNMPLTISDKPITASVDAAKLVFPLLLRQWQTGDYLYPLGMKHRQKLSDFFIHKKVPLPEKKKFLCW